MSLAPVIMKCSLAFGHAGSQGGANGPPFTGNYFSLTTRKGGFFLS